MYEKFLDKSLNSTRQTVDDTFIAKYANAVSEQIIELWKEVGLGTFCDGLFDRKLCRIHQCKIRNIQDFIREC